MPDKLCNSFEVISLIRSSNLIIFIAKPPSSLEDILVLPILIVLAATYKESHLYSAEPKLNVSVTDGNIFPETTISPVIVLFTINLLLVPGGIVSVVKVSVPVPPFAISKTPVISLAPKSRANLLFWITRPPSAFVSIDKVCAEFSISLPVVDKPLPAVTVATKLPVVWLPSVMRLLRVVAPVPPSLTANVPVIELAPKSTANLFSSMIRPPPVLASIDNVCAAFSISLPVVAKPLPAVTVAT